jgi:hypothetical protein
LGWQGPDGSGAEPLNEQLIQIPSLPKVFSMESGLILFDREFRLVEGISLFSYSNGYPPEVVFREMCNTPLNYLNDLLENPPEYAVIESRKVNFQLLGNLVVGLLTPFKIFLYLESDHPIDRKLTASLKFSTLHLGEHQDPEFYKFSILCEGLQMILTSYLDVESLDGIPGIENIKGVNQIAFL